MNWTMIATFATAVSALTVAVTAFLAFLQLRRLRLSQEVTTALTLYDRSTCKEMLDAASWVKTQMPDDFSYEDYQGNSEARQKLDRLWYYFEFLGVLVVRDNVSEDLIFDQQGAFIAGIWDKSQGLIEARRKDRKSPQYMENFEILRKRFVSWAAGYHPKLSPRDVRQTRDYYGGENPSPSY